MEYDPIQAIERMNEFDLLQFISPKIQYTKALKNLLEEIKGIISWFNLLYLEEPYEEWKVYWHGLTSNLEAKDLNELAERMQMVDLESRKMISQKLDINQALNRLNRIKEDNNYGVYTLLSQYGTEILLYMMAKANKEKIKRLISNYFTRLKGIKIGLTGRDLKELGFQPGLLYKEILDSLLEAKLNNQILSEEDEIRFVKETYGRHVESIE